LPDLQHLEIDEAEIMVESGLLEVTDCGSENTYYADRAGRQYYCKNYPQTWSRV
jgi:hypothetical protein